MIKTITIPTKLKIPPNTNMINIRIPLQLEYIETNIKKNYSKLDAVKGMLSNRNIIDPLEYQKKTRKEWD